MQQDGEFMKKNSLALERSEYWFFQYPDGSKISEVLNEQGSRKVYFFLVPVREPSTPRMISRPNWLPMA